MHEDETIAPDGAGQQAAGTRYPRERADQLPPLWCLLFSKLDTYVRVTGDDWQRLGAAADQMAHFIGHRAYMKMTDDHCAALELRRTAGGATEFFCTVYADRPQVCRDLARGSAQCQGERAAKRGRTGGLMT